MHRSYDTTNRSAPLTEAEHAAIAEAIASGRRTVCPAGTFSEDAVVPLRLQIKRAAEAGKNAYRRRLQEQAAARREVALTHLKSGLSQSETARRMHVSAETIRCYAADLRKEGRL